VTQKAPIKARGDAAPLYLLPGLICSDYVWSAQVGQLAPQVEVERAPHGPHGGDLVIGGRVATGQVEAVFFFRDPLTAQPHEPDVSALMRVCDVHHVPLATNLGSAEAVVGWLK